ncbi:MAG: response regulator, partial [Lachnospiraceae bacterium]|nr:response regulator [Lachnospiraceae bacterium]
PAPAQKKADFSEVRILLVEDQEINRQIETKILSRAGFRIEYAENGRVAVDKISASEPGYYQIVLMDINMPEMNGYEAAQAIRALPDPALSSVPIVAMTANAFHEDIQKAHDCGMNDHIAKPIEIPRMMEVLTRILGSS